jgi:hypothetical protein
MYGIEERKERKASHAIDKVQTVIITLRRLEMALKKVETLFLRNTLRP